MPVDGLDTMGYKRHQFFYVAPEGTEQDLCPVRAGPLPVDCTGAVLGSFIDQPPGMMPIEGMAMSNEHVSACERKVT